MAWVNRALSKAAGDVSIIWNRGPIILSRHCVAQPDLAVLRLREDGYSSRTPTVDDVLLVVEIAGMEVPLARLWKARLYAAAGVPECWTLDNIECRMEIHCLPEQKTYRLIREVGPSDAVQPRMLAGCSVRIADLLLPRTYNQKSRG
jgi:Uma2 family endonuclease